jgi:E3 ubiquitin-protein ligase FANCL
MSGSRSLVIPDPDSPGLSLCLLSIGNTDFIFRASQDPLFFEAESKLTHLLRGKEEYIRLELERSLSLEAFCQRICHLISKLSSVRATDLTPPQSSFFKRVLDEIREIGWDRISNVDPTLSFFEVFLLDATNRRIEIRFDFPADFPRTRPKVTSNLPNSNDTSFEWDPQTSRLVNIVDLYEKFIPSFAFLWKQLDELDKDAYVIEPREPSLSCCLRRIVVTNQVEIQIEVSPRRPMSLPKVTFMGAEAATREMRTRFESQLGKWNPADSLKTNLEELLEVSLPRRDAEELAETDFDCGICYMERLGSELPQVVCGNAKCGKRYHRSCLVDWLKTRQAEQSFQVVFGTCPYCDQPLQCSISERD